MTGHRLVNVADLDFAEAVLISRIAVILYRLDLGDNAGTGLDSSYGNNIPAFIKKLGHAELFSDDCFFHYFFLLVVIGRSFDRHDLSSGAV